MNIRQIIVLIGFLLFALGCSEHGVKVDVPQGNPMGTDSDSTDGTDNTGDSGSIDTTTTDTSEDTSDSDTAGTDPVDDSDTVLPVCGNGRLETGELCDDGNVLDSDGCYGNCLNQDTDFDCSVPGQACIKVAECGNGILERAEACDEGTNNKTEGCSATCDAVTDGWSCPRPGRSCVLLPVCGDGVRSKGEQCDDGNVATGDGCSAICEQQEGYLCIPGAACVALVCGDGNRTPDEKCDDGNASDNDGCSASCEVEPGYRCSSVGCFPICGDGIVLATEDCDDGNRASGDGCSVQCGVEPYYVCDASEPSVCTSSISCGNGEVEPGEICDPGVAGHDLCYDTDAGTMACKGYQNDLVAEPVCGNGVIELGEQCDGDNGEGCTESCEVEDGFECPMVNYCYKPAVCGNGAVESGEQCDTGATTSLACVDCQVQEDWYCAGSPSVCVESVCGDNVKAPDEQCDYDIVSDGIADNGDGCSSSCELESGWVCPPGDACMAICGDGVVIEGEEDCDDQNDEINDGCHNCRAEQGYDCTTGSCVETVCGNDIKENGEGCDDGNFIAGDGCGPTCQLEPSVTVGRDPTVNTVCGDGLVTVGEQCDDGNSTSGDGCSSTCAEEPGWNCEENINDIEYPDSLQIRVTYRDFKHRSRVGGHPHMVDPNLKIPHSELDPEIVGTVCDAGNTGTCGRLDAAGKPALAPDEIESQYVTIFGGAEPGLDIDYHKAAFSLFFRDSNTTVLDAASQIAGSGSFIDVIANPLPLPAAGVDTLELTQDPTVASKYVFSSNDNTFYPLGRSNVSNNDLRGHRCSYANGTDTTCGEWNNFAYTNYHFTSEMRYFFQYQGGETLSFFGDDDVWVFINGRLAVDIGGIHSTRWGRVVLGDDGANGTADDSDCSVGGYRDNRIPGYDNDEDDPGGTYVMDPVCDLQVAEMADNDDVRFNLQKGGLYEIVVFQVERKPTGSNYRLTLDGFIAPRSYCSTTCGDGVAAGTEICDEGTDNVDGQYGVCNTACEYTYCGDGEVQSPDEVCDDGLNVDAPWAADLATAEVSCIGCERPAYCGDGILQPAYELCDNGDNVDNYGGCAPDCQSLGGYCGDGDVDAGEESCDPGPGNFVFYQADGNGCGYDCQPAPSCGDGVRNGEEQCDAADAATPLCGADCQYPPYCGDGLLANDGSEQCDYGDFAFRSDGTPVYGGCSTDCDLGPYCGDGIVASEVEECDQGSANSDVVYEGCSIACTLGLRCGDGVVQVEQGEQCDNGYNEDIYMFTEDSCGEGCVNLPRCGDAIVQSEFEWCDNGDALNADNAYDGCSSTCQWGPYCGDGIVQEEYEQCDLGAQNAAWSLNAGCGYDCQPAPFCGDGIRNGSEQCDEGTDGNVGGYGGCNENCTLAPYCGNNIIERQYGETCDDGPIGSLSCYTNCKIRGVAE